MTYFFGDIIEKNISKRVFYSICVVTVAIAFLDFLFTFISEISDVSNSYFISDAFLYSVNSIPNSIYSYLPYITLLGVLIGLGSLKDEGEIIAAKVLGKSDLNMVIASLRPAILLIILGLVFQEMLLPSISQKNEENRLIKQERLSPEEGYWYASDSSINFFKSSPSRENINDITIYQTGDNNILKIIESKFAKRTNGKWTLFDLRIKNYQDNSISHQDQMSWNDGPDEQDMRRILSPKYFSFNELNSALSEEISEYRSNALLLEYWRKIFHPITTVLLIFLAASFVFGKVRDDGLGKRVLLGVIFAFSLNIIKNLFESMASVSFLTPLSAVTLPLLMVLVFSAIFWYFRPH